MRQAAAQIGPASVRATDTRGARALTSTLRPADRRVEFNRVLPVNPRTSLFLRSRNLTMRLSDAGARRQTKMLDPNHRLPPWLTEDATPRSLQPIVRYQRSRRGEATIDIRSGVQQIRIRRNIATRKPFLHQPRTGRHFAESAPASLFLVSASPGQILRT